MDEEIAYFSKDYCDNHRKQIYEYYCKGQFYDVTITVGERQFYCHRVILATGTNYFLSMFSSGMQEAFSDKVEMKDLDPEVFARTLEFIYTGKVSISMDTVCEQYRQAYILQVQPLVELCTDYFTQKISVDNCLGIYQLADTYTHSPLFNITTAYICKHFSECSGEDDFMHLSIDCVTALFKSRRLNCNTEDEVFVSAMQWLDYDHTSRKVHIYRILECIKFPLLTRSYFMDVVSKTLSLIENDSIHELIDDATTFHTIPSRRPMLPSYQVTPRFSHPFFEVAVLLGGRYSEGLRNDVECFRPDTNEFFSLKPLPFKKRNEFAVCSSGNEIFVSGGLRSSEFWKYDATFDSWLRGPVLCNPRRRHAMVSVDDAIYVLGGFDEEHVLGSVEKWNKCFNRWEECGHLTIPVENMGAAAHGPNIFLFGGKNNEEQVCNTIQSYDTASNQCTVLEKVLPAHDMCVSAVSLHQHIYVVGLEGVFCFNPYSLDWHILAEIPYPRDFISLVAMNGQLFAIGGRRRGSKENLFSDCLDVYDIATDQWSMVCHLPQPLYCYGCTKVYLTQRPKHSLEGTPTCVDS